MWTRLCRPWWPLAVLAAVGLATPSPLRAQADHLKCYKIKDTALKATYTVDLDGLAPEPGCVVKVPAALFCVQTHKQVVSTPPPPGAPPGPDAGRFACYKVKCPKGVLGQITISDQFATRTVSPGNAQLLCAPVQLAGVTTTTTASTTTTTLSQEVACCAATGAAACLWLPGQDCVNFPGTPGTLSSSCDSATGQCKAAASAGNCCTVTDPMLGQTACIAGPGVDQALCDQFNQQGQTSTFVPNATCLINGACM